MKPGGGAATAEKLGAGADSAALLSVFRPFCMSAMIALEEMLMPEGFPVRVVRFLHRRSDLLSEAAL